MIYIIWVPIAIIYMFIGAYFSNKLNTTHDNKWWIIQYGWSLMPIWTMVCRFSNNIVFDAVLYDLIILITYSFSLIILTRTSLSQTKWIGLALIFIGMILFKK